MLGFQRDWVDGAKVLKEFCFVLFFVFSPWGEQTSFAEAAARQQAVTEMEKPGPHFSNLVPDIILRPPCKSLWVDTTPSLFLHWPFTQQEMFSKSYWVTVGVGHPSGSLVTTRQTRSQAPWVLEDSEGQNGKQAATDNLCGPACSVVADSATPWPAARQAPLSTGILQARRLERVAMPSSRGIFLTQGSNSHLLP